MNWLSLITGIPEQIGQYFRERQAQKSAERLRKLELEDALHKRKLDLVSQGLTADMNWEMEFARQAETSWKDEYTLIVISIPAVMAFIPSLSGYVSEGFKALQETPMWYRPRIPQRAPQCDPGAPDLAEKNPPPTGPGGSPRQRSQPG